MKCIRCPRAVGEKWLKDLRSGEYKQGQRFLSSECGRYCCLGVLQMGVSGRVEKNSIGGAATLPSKAWLEAYGIQFIGGTVNTVDREKCTPFLPKLGTTADDANDDGASFEKIADAIEETMEFTD